MKALNLFRLFWVIPLVSLYSAARAQEYPAYEIVDLGTLGGISSHAHGINARGEITGVSAVASGENHAFLWSELNGMVDLGTLGGANSAGVDINDTGSVVGESQTASGQLHAFLWEDGSLHDMHPIGHESGAWEIDAAGAITGWYDEGMERAGFLQPADGEAILRSMVSDVLLFDDGGSKPDLGPIDIPSVAGYTSGRYVAINGNGIMVGQNTGPSGPRIGVIYTPDQGLFDVNDLLDPQSGAGWHIPILCDLNENGWLVGTGELDGVQHAVLLRPISREENDGAIGGAMLAPASSGAVANTITLISPNGGELIPRGTLYTIRWSSTGNVGDNVRIISRKGNAAGSIVASTPDDGLFEWLVPLNFPLGTNNLLEISSVSTPSVLDSSDAFFTVVEGNPIYGTLTVVSPNGGEALQRGTTTSITWTTTGNIGPSVRIYLRRGTTGFNIASSTPNDGRFDWTVPMLPVGTGYSIEISAELSPVITDSCDSSFSLTDTPPPVASISVTAPSAGASFYQGDTLPIAWNSAGDVGALVQITARVSGNSYAIATSTANDGAYNWLVPQSQPPGSDYHIEVRSVSRPEIVGLGAALSISTRPQVRTITVVFPNGGQTFVRGSTIEVLWNSQGDVGDVVKIVVRKGTSRSEIAGRTPNDGRYNWTIPSAYPLGSGMSVEIISVQAPAVSDTSDAPFSLSDLPSSGISLVVTSPAGGESYYPGESVPVRWNTTGISGSTVQILARSAGQLFTISPGTEDDGLYEWRMPRDQIAGSDYTIEVRSLSR